MFTYIVRWLGTIVEVFDMPQFRMIFPCGKRYSKDKAKLYYYHLKLQ
jgi:hypothetical protein